MRRRGIAADPPAPAEFESVFHVREVRRDGDTVRYIGDPLVPPDAVERQVARLFRTCGYEVSLTRPSGPARGYVLVAEPPSTGHDGVPWTNIVLLLATIASTLYVGASWYHIPLDEEPLRVLEAWPFTVAMLGVLGIHELGHYALGRYHGVDTTLPYFIPFPSLIGTMGAVINIRGQIPDRRALFDIGVAGPIAGLVATIVVTVVGLLMDPITVPERLASGDAGYVIEFHNPLLLTILVELTGQPASYPSPTRMVNPVVFAGWAGMFFTFLNLLPVGQLDGGHIVRAVLGDRQRTVAAAVPGALFALAGYIYVTHEAAVGIGTWALWAFWGVFALGLAYAGPATPAIDDDRIGPRRRWLGAVTFLFGILCFTPIPFEVMPA
ncbi:MAG: site-2 protease family protein [Haloarculaceae archaeon]